MADIIPFVIAGLTTAGGVFGFFVKQTIADLKQQIADNKKELAEQKEASSKKNDELTKKVHDLEKARERDNSDLGHAITTMHDIKDTVKELVKNYE